MHAIDRIHFSIHGLSLETLRQYFCVNHFVLICERVVCHFIVSEQKNLLMMHVVIFSSGVKLCG